MRRPESRRDEMFIAPLPLLNLNMPFPLSLWERARVRVLARKTNQVKVFLVSVPLPSPLPKGEGVWNLSADRMSFHKLALSLLLLIGLSFALPGSAHAACSGG